MNPLSRGLACAAACLWLTAVPVRAGTLDALELFARLPVTLFENTPEGLSEDEKLRLIEQGESESWQVERFDADSFVMVSRPFGETRVSMHLFRGGPSLLVALGMDNGSMCALELWQEDATGGFVPANPPEEPQVSDFFSRGQRLAHGLSLACEFCLNGDGLDVRPLIWGPGGLVEMPADRLVRYIWKNGHFEKTLSDRLKQPAP